MLAGLVFPGDILLSVCGVPAVNARAAAETMVESDFLRLQVLTLVDAETIFLDPGLKGLELVKDKRTGLPRVTAAPHTTLTHDVELASEKVHLAVDDLIVAVGASDGIIYAVDTPKAVQQRLREASSTQGLIEMRVARGADPAPGAASFTTTKTVTRCVAQSAVRHASSQPPTDFHSGRWSPSGLSAGDSSDLSERSTEVYVRAERRRSAELPHQPNGALLNVGM